MERAGGAVATAVSERFSPRPTVVLRRPGQQRRRRVRRSLDCSPNAASMCALRRWRPPGGRRVAAAHHGAARPGRFPSPRNGRARDRRSLRRRSRPAACAGRWRGSRGRWRRGSRSGRRRRFPAAFPQAHGPATWDVSFRARTHELTFTDLSQPTWLQRPGRGLCGEGWWWAISDWARESLEPLRQCAGAMVGAVSVGLSSTAHRAPTPEGRPDRRQRRSLELPARRGFRARRLADRRRAGNDPLAAGGLVCLSTAAHLEAVS